MEPIESGGIGGRQAEEKPIARLLPCFSLVLPNENIYNSHIMGMKTRPKCAVLLVNFAIVLALAPARAQTFIQGVYPAKGYSVGCQANTFNRFTVFEAIEKTMQADGRIIEFYPDQKLSKEEPDVLWNHNASDEIIAKVKPKLAQDDILAVSYGVVNIPKDEPQARRLFEFAVKVGLRTLITESVEAIDTLEKLAKVYDVGVAYHHHHRRLNDTG